MENIISKIKAVVLGHAVADALGVPVEFMSRSELERSPVTGMMGFGTYPVPAGAWSDDTSMSVAALDSIADGKIDWDAIMTAFADWCDRDKYTPTGELFDIGITCRRAIRRYVCDEIPATECGLDNENSNGNGSLMRIHPFSLMAWCTHQSQAEWEPMIDLASALTHAHGRSKLACRIYTVLLHKLLDAPTKESIGIALQEANCLYADHPELVYYARLFAEDFAKLPCDAIKSTGYVVDSMEAAIWCLLTTDSYAECVLKAVNLGADTDTVAAIAGGLAGALYGIEAIPQEWLNTLLCLESIEEMCERAGKGWRV